MYECRRKRGPGKKTVASVAGQLGRSGGFARGTACSRGCVQTYPLVIDTQAKRKEKKEKTWQM
jgi:hypothetical protein